MIGATPKKMAFAAAGLACGGVLCCSASGWAARQGGKSTSKPEESELHREVRHQIQVAPYYSVFDYITYTLDGGKVTLRGYVLRPTLREDAEEGVKSIEGVAVVENRIEVLPRSADDDSLRRAIYRAIFEDAILQRYGGVEQPSIHIIVKGGAVALEGVVESESDKSQATTRVSSVPGVSNLQNHLSIRAKTSKAN